MGWWTTDPLSIGVIAVPSAIYLRGVRHLWRTVGRRAGIQRWEVAAWCAGQLSLLIALISPVDRLSDFLFSAHMTQHEIIMVVAPPLIVLGRPWVALLWALPQPLRLRVAGALRERRIRWAWKASSSPLVTLVVHAIIVWLWHVPALFEAALESERVHAVQHASFFASAAFFWWAVIRGRYGRAGYGAAAAFVFVTAMHTSILGALITVARSVWYPIYTARGASYGVDAQDDQVLAGLVMWIPSGVLLTMVALALFAAWLGEAGRRVQLAEQRRVGNLLHRNDHSPDASPECVVAPAAGGINDGAPALSCSRRDE